MEIILKNCFGCRYVIYMYIFFAVMTESEQYRIYSPVAYRQDTHNKERLSLADWNSYNYREPQGAGTYAFGYDIDDAKTANTQFRDEERHPDGSVTGSYGFVDTLGIAHIVHYIADTKGYRARVETRGGRYEQQPNYYPVNQNRPPYYEKKYSNERVPVTYYNKY